MAPKTFYYSWQLKLRNKKLVGHFTKCFFSHENVLGDNMPSSGLSALLTGVIFSHHILEVRTTTVATLETTATQRCGGTYPGHKPDVAGPMLMAQSPSKWFLRQLPHPNTHPGQVLAPQAGLRHPSPTTPFTPPTPRCESLQVAWPAADRAGLQGGGRATAQGHLGEKKVTPEASSYCYSFTTQNLIATDKIFLLNNSLHLNAF